VRVFYSDEDIIARACRAHFFPGGFGKGFIPVGILSLEQRDTTESSNPFGLTGNERYYFHCVIVNHVRIFGAVILWSAVIHSHARLWRDALHDIVSSHSPLACAHAARQFLLFYSVSVCVNNIFNAMNRSETPCVNMRVDHDIIKNYL